MQEACTTGEEMDERDRDIFFFGSIPLLIVCYSVRNSEEKREADVLFGIGLLFLGLFRIDTRFF